MRRVLLALAVAATLALSGCGSHNTDPRKGVVNIDSSNCAWGGCYDLTEVCVGPDLRIMYDESGDDDYTRTFHDSPECAS